MKAKSIFIFIFIVLVNISCRTDRNITSTDYFNNTNNKPLHKLPTLQFGTLSLEGYPTDISHNVIYGWGWKGVKLSANYLDPTAIACINAARTAGYTLIIASLDFDSIYHGSLSSLTYIQNEITWAKNNGAQWFYLDDALTNALLPPNYKLISVDNINHVASMVHAANCLFATGEGMSADLKNLMQQYPHWHDNVDVIIPYAYSADVNTLDSYLSWLVNNKHKPLLPVIGYYAEDNWPSSRIQRGIKSGDPGFIELAQKYSSFNMVFYFTLERGPLIYFYEITSYLNCFYGMGTCGCY